MLMKLGRGVDCTHADEDVPTLVPLELLYKSPYCRGSRVGPYQGHL